jgi:hypothetical protein
MFIKPSHHATEFGLRAIPAPHSREPSQCDRIVEHVNVRTVLMLDFRRAESRLLVNMITRRHGARIVREA